MVPGPATARSAQSEPARWRAGYSDFYCDDGDGELRADWALSSLA